tara:strand:- start:251 stop:847 length:597 start_codon:yes stop_codon:yes gene_type:complete
LKNFFKNIQNILIISLVVIILWLQNCSGGGSGVVNPEPTIIKEVTTLYDTITDTIPEYVPQWEIKVETRFLTDTFYPHVDTPTILKDYYARYVYADTIKIDTIGYLVVNDSVSRNQIYSRKIKTNILLPTTIIKQTSYITQREFYMGLKVQGRTDQLNYVGGELLFKTRKDKAYSVGVGLNQEFQPVISGGMFFKIGK